MWVKKSEHLNQPWQALIRKNTYKSEEELNNCTSVLKFQTLKKLEWFYFRTLFFCPELKSSVIFCKECIFKQYVFYHIGLTAKRKQIQLKWRCKQQSCDQYFKTAKSTDLMYLQIIYSDCRATKIQIKWTTVQVWNIYQTMSAIVNVQDFDVRKWPKF